MIMSRKLITIVHNNKKNNVLVHGLVDSKNQRILDDKTGKPMNMKWLFGWVQASDKASLDSQLSDLSHYMIAQRVIGAVNKRMNELDKEYGLGTFIAMQKRLNSLYDSKDFSKLSQARASGMVVTNDEGEKVKLSKDIVSQQYLFGGFGAGWETSKTDMSAARDMGNHFDKNVKKSNPEYYKRLVEGARRYRAWMDTLLQYMEDGGLMSKEKILEIRKNNDHYVAMSRLMENDPNSPLFVEREEGSTYLTDAIDWGQKQISKVVPKLSTQGALGQADPFKAKGYSDKLVIDPYASLVNITQRAIRNTDRNKVLSTFVNLLNPNISYVTQEDMEDFEDMIKYSTHFTDEEKEEMKANIKLGMAQEMKTQTGYIPFADVAVQVPSKTSGNKTLPNVKTIWVDGKEQHWQFASTPAAQQVLDAINGAEIISTRMPSIVTILPKVLRYSIISSLPFAIRNIQRDTWNRMIISENDFSLADYSVFNKPFKTDIEPIGWHKGFLGEEDNRYFSNRFNVVEGMIMRGKSLYDDDLKNKSTRVVTIDTKTGKEVIKEWNEDEFLNQELTLKQLMLEASKANLDVVLLKKWDKKSGQSKSAFRAQKAKEKSDLMIDIAEQSKDIFNIVDYQNAKKTGRLRRGVSTEMSMLNRLEIFGANQAGFYLQDKMNFYRLMAEEMDKISNNTSVWSAFRPQRIMPTMKKGWKTWMDTVQMSEVANRLVEFKAAYRQAKKRGLDDYNAQLYASYQARNLIDFAVIGEQMKWINQIAPFTNAFVQGIHRSLVHPLRKSYNYRNGKKDYRNLGMFALKATAFSLLPMLVEKGMAMLNSADGDDDENYMTASHQKDLFWNFKLADDLVLTIPKPFEIGVIGSAMGRTWDRYILGEERAFENWDRN